jgi:hypothetical protein
VSCIERQSGGLVQVKTYHANAYSGAIPRIMQILEAFDHQNWAHVKSLLPQK